MPTTHSDIANLAQTLQALERAVHQACLENLPDRLADLLDDRFIEFGRSGRSYNKADQLKNLSEDQPAELHAQDFAVLPLSAEVALLTYRSANVTASGELERHSLRSSIWSRVEGRWQMVFHQGTATAPFAEATN
jgi:hypothetical protein